MESLLLLSIMAWNNEVLFFVLLQVDANYQDGLELFKMLCVYLGNKEYAQQYMLNRLAIPFYSGNSPVVVGASTFRGTRIGHMGWHKHLRYPGRVH